MRLRVCGQELACLVANVAQGCLPLSAAQGVRRLLVLVSYIGTVLENALDFWREFVLAFQLAPYLHNWDEICRKKFGRSYEFAPLEDYFREHVTGKRHLTAKDVGKLFNPENTPFAKYWPRPHGKALDEILTQNRVYVGPLSNDSKALIEKLLSVFHNVGTASLVLRFVHPSRFGIFSTPVIHLLQVMRPGTVDLYLAYCDELERWCQHFGMASVAQTETALWTFAELAKLSDSDAAAIKARREFDDDMWAQREEPPKSFDRFSAVMAVSNLLRFCWTKTRLLLGRSPPKNTNACWASPRWRCDTAPYHARRERRKDSLRSWLKKATSDRRTSPSSRESGSRATRSFILPASALSVRRSR